MTHVGFSVGDLIQKEIKYHELEDPKLILTYFPAFKFWRWHDANQFRNHVVTVVIKNKPEGFNFLCSYYSAGRHEISQNVEGDFQGQA